MRHNMHISIMPCSQQSTVHYVIAHMSNASSHDYKLTETTICCQEWKSFFQRSRCCKALCLCVGVRRPDKVHNDIWKTWAINKLINKVVYIILLDALWHTHQQNCLSQSDECPCSRLILDLMTILVCSSSLPSNTYLLVYHMLGPMLLMTHCICPSSHPCTRCCLLASFHLCLTRFLAKFLLVSCGPLQLACNVCYMMSFTESACLESNWCLLLEHAILTYVKVIILISLTTPAYCVTRCMIPVVHFRPCPRQRIFKYICLSCCELSCPKQYVSSAL